MELVFWVGLIAALIIIGKLLEREIYFYEGVHLGPRVQAWLYDRWARRYDEDKRESQLHDDAMLAGPLLEALKEIPEPFILDFATGTGRLSYALLSQPDFKGHIIALDLSQGMLEKAAEKLSRADGSAGTVELLRHLALPLPFPDSAFDAVCALEVLELFPDMDVPLAEFGRVLRPGGVFLSSRGTEASGRKARVKSAAELEAALTRHGFAQVQISAWWKFFDRVFAVKSGWSTPSSFHRLGDVLRCPACDQIAWNGETGAMRCLNCSRDLPITGNGVVLR